MKRYRSKRVSQKDIALKLGLSRATVANILSGNLRLAYSAETRERVLSAAREMGYQVDRASRTIRSGRSNLIGIIHFGGAFQGSGSLAVALPQAINAEGYDSLVIDLRWHGGDVERVLREVIQSRVEGVIISHGIESFRREHVEVLERAGIPCVSLYGDDRLGIPLFCDNAASSYCALTDHLLHLGHRHLLLLISTTVSRWNRERIEGFRAAIQPVGTIALHSETTFFQNGSLPLKEGFSASIVEIDIKRHGYDAMLAGFHFGERLFSHGAWPGVILCANDDAAFGLINAAVKHRLSIPQDGAVTGFDDRKLARYPVFDLTTVGTDVAEASRATVGALAAFLREESPTISGQIFDSWLVLRRSCGRSDTDTEPERIVPIPSDYHETSRFFPAPADLCRPSRLAAPLRRRVADGRGQS